MLELRKWKADIEEKPPVPGSRGMTVEFWAVDEKQAREKLDWLVGDRTRKNWFSLEELEETK